MPIEYFLLVLLCFFVYLLWRDRNLNRLIDVHWSETSEHLDDARLQIKRLAKRERQLLNLLLYKKQGVTLDAATPILPPGTRKEITPGIHTSQEEMDLLEEDFIREEVEIALERWKQEQSSREVSEQELAHMMQLFTEQAIEKREAEKLAK